MPHIETSFKMNKKDRTAIRNLNSLQDPNDGHTNKIQSSRDKIRTKQFNKRKKIVLNADQIKDKDVSHNERKTVGQRKRFDSKINAIKISHSQTSIKMNKKDRNAFRNLTSLHNPNDGDINKIQAKRDQIRTEQIDIRNKILLNADQIKDKDLSQKERKTVRPQERINSKINAIKIPHSETSIKMNKKDRTAIRDLTFVQDPNGGDTNKIQLNRDLIRTEQINTRNKIPLNADKIRAEQINIRKNILLNANQIRTKQFNKRKKILLNSDKIKEKDVSQNERKVVGPQKTINSKPNAIKIPYSETSITINKKDRNAIRNRTSLQNQNDGDTNTHNKFHYNDKSNDSVGSRLKPVIRSLNSFQLVDQLVHKRGQSLEI
ncbi:unnamed protein product [Mytilus coruscus]|nr:unnamed protein product [Mytilus coruscus]